MAIFGGTRAKEQSKHVCTPAEQMEDSLSLSLFVVCGQTNKRAHKTKKWSFVVCGRLGTWAQILESVRIFHKLALLGILLGISHTRHRLADTSSNGFSTSGD